MNAFIFIALSLGFLGSFHCIGMCGPIAMALPIHREKPATRLFLTLVYNGGRILVYAVFGLMAGLLGQGFFAAGLQQVLSVGIGIILLLSAIAPLFFKKNLGINTGIYSAMSGLRATLSGLFLKKGSRPLFLIGLLNGLLPCGLVYMGVAGSLATGDPLKGMLFMALFGLGTLPAMLAMPLIVAGFNLRFRNNIRKAMPVLVSITAVLLILRGLNLGIPFVSPKIENKQVSACHQQLQPPNKKTILCTGHVTPLSK